MIKSIFDSNLDKNHLRVLVELFDLQYKQDPKNLEYSRNKTKRIDRKILLKKVKMKKEIFLKKVKELISKKLISVDSKDYVKYHKEHYRGGPLKVKKKNGLTDKIGFLVFNYKKFNKDYGVKFETIFNTFTNRIHIIDYPLYAPVFPQETISNLKKL
ncbi:MAG: hypothetical protein U9Q06_01270, partial [Nanoarchaeota archaeon]|nr:hypothetical protein [Nanoarchaeota archaeon]